MSDQMDEQVEHRRFDVARRRAQRQSLTDGINRAIAKDEDHHWSLGTCRGKNGEKSS
jgi:hypothetical protein